MNVLHVLGRLVRLEPRQGDLLNGIGDRPLLNADDLRAAGAFDGRRGRPTDQEGDCSDETER